MFFALHRALKFVIFCVFAFAAWEVYRHRQVFEPAVVWYDVWDNGGFNQPPLRAVTGNVERVVTSQVFVMKSTNVARFNVRLLGLDDPPKEMTAQVVEEENERKKTLEEMIRGQAVTLQVGYENLNNLGGFVFLNGTNINAQLVRNNLAATSKERVKGFPKELQYQMLWAKRHRASNN